MTHRYVVSIGYEKYVFDDPDDVAAILRLAQRSRRVEHRDRDYKVLRFAEDEKQFIAQISYEEVEQDPTTLRITPSPIPPQIS